MKYNTYHGDDTNTYSFNNAFRIFPPIPTIFKFFQKWPWAPLPRRATTEKCLAQLPWSTG